MRKILIVDDHQVVRDGVKRILDQQAEGTFCGEAGTATEALQVVREESWDLVLLDLALGSRSGLELLKELHEIRPKLPVVILSMHSEEQYARRAFKAGAVGYVTKDAPTEELVLAVNKTIQGHRYVSSALAETLAADLGRQTDGPVHESLSNRELEVACLIGSGKTPRQIASYLCLSDKTISTYRARILEKMGLRTNAELIRYVVEHHLVQ